MTKELVNLHTSRSVQPDETTNGGDNTLEEQSYDVKPQPTEGVINQEIIIESPIIVNDQSSDVINAAKETDHVNVVIISENEDAEVEIKEANVAVVLKSDAEGLNISSENDETSQKLSQEMLPKRRRNKRKLVRQFYCNICGVLCENFRKLLIHIFNADDEHFFKCASCEYKIGNTLTEVNRHIKDFCGFSKISEAEHSIALLPTTQSRYFCEACGKGYQILTDLQSHYKEHSGELFCCSLCPYKALNFMDLMNHSKVHSVHHNVELNCSFCSLRFYSSTPYRLHHYLVHSQCINIPYECSLCPRVIIDDEDKFMLHVQSHCEFYKKKFTFKRRPIAPDVSKYTCEHCAQMFASVAECQEHRISDHNLNNTIYRQCPLCPGETTKVVFTEISTHLKDHRKEIFEYFPKRRDHPLFKNKPNQESKTAGNIINQTTASQIENKTVNDEKSLTTSSNNPIAELRQDPLSPEKVEKIIFTETSKNLKKQQKKTVPEHRQPFVPSRKFKCNYCDRGFRTPRSLNAHTVAKHKILQDEIFDEAKLVTTLTNNSTTELPPSTSISLSQPVGKTKCNDCNKTFMSVQALKEHTKMHYKEWEKNGIHTLKPVDCSVVSHQAENSAVLLMNQRNTFESHDVNNQNIECFLSKNSTRVSQDTLPGQVETHSVPTINRMRSVSHPKDEERTIFENYSTNNSRREQYSDAEVSFRGEKTLYFDTRNTNLDTTNYRRMNSPSPSRRRFSPTLAAPQHSSSSFSKEKEHLWSENKRYNDPKPRFNNELYLGTHLSSRGAEAPYFDTESENLDTINYRRIKPSSSRRQYSPTPSPPHHSSSSFGNEKEGYWSSNTYENSSLPISSERERNIETNIYKPGFDNELSAKYYCNTNLIHALGKTDSQGNPYHLEYSFQRKTEPSSSESTYQKTGSQVFDIHSSYVREGTSQSKEPQHKSRDIRGNSPRRYRSQFREPQQSNYNFDERQLGSRESEKYDLRYLLQSKESSSRSREFQHDFYGKPKSDHATHRSNQYHKAQSQYQNYDSGNHSRSRRSPIPSRRHTSRSREFQHRKMPNDRDIFNRDEDIGLARRNP